MKGIHYVTDDVGKRIAVLIKLAEWEDIQDVLVSESRKNESTGLWEKLKTEIKTNDKRSASSVLFKI